MLMCFLTKLTMEVVTKNEVVDLRVLRKNDMEEVMEARSERRKALV